MSLAVWYYSYVFLSMLFILGRVITLDERLTINREDIKRCFSVFCASFLVWSFSIVVVGVVKIEVFAKGFLLLGEFCRIGTLLTGTELCASITDRIISKKEKVIKVTSIMLYEGVAVLFISLILNKARLSRGVFGEFLSSDNDIALALYIIYNVLVVFIYISYTYIHHYTSNKAREYYISKKLLIIVIILSVALLIEALGYIFLNQFVPSMHLGMLICIYLFYKLISYKRSVEYHEGDYSRILAPSYAKSAFVCNDEGIIIFENTRAQVMSQTYKDKYVGKYLTDAFVLSDVDREKLKDASITSPFRICCKYEKNSKDIELIVKHNIDKFGAIFSTEVEVDYVGN